MTLYRNVANGQSKKASVIKGLREGCGMVGMGGMFQYA